MLFSRRDTRIRKFLPSSIRSEFCLLNPRSSLKILIPSRASPTWSALAAQVTGAGGSTVVDSDGSGSESAASSSSGVLSDASSSAPVVTSQVTTTRATVMPTHGAPKSSDPSSTPSSNSEDSGNGASSVKFGSAISITVLASILMITAQ